MTTLTTAEFTVGDTAPALSGTCTSTIGTVTTPVDLSTATALVVHIERTDRIVITRDATAGTDLGSWSLAWALDGTDLTVRGGYVVEIEATWGDGTVTTFGPAYFRVRDQIA